MLSITKSAYAYPFLDQNDGQASEDTLNVSGLFSLSTIITENTGTPGIANTNLSNTTIY